MSAIPHSGSRRVLNRRQKAAVIIGVLGAEAAGPILEQFDEQSLRHFTEAMSGLTRVDAIDVRATIAEFLAELTPDDDSVTGGLANARSLLEDHVAEGLLTRILEEALPATGENVWPRLAKIDDKALAEFLAQEHPQTAAVVLSKFPPERAALVLNRLAPEAAQEIVLGLATTGSLDHRVIDAIADATGRDVLAALGNDSSGEAAAADRAGAIMDYTSPAIRDEILGRIGDGHPTMAADIRRRMFTVEDIPARVPKIAVAAIVRTLDQDVLLKALSSLRSTNPEVAEFLLGNISSRIAAQLQEDLAELPEIRQKDGEAAQTDLIKTIRNLAARGEIEVTDPHEEVEDA